MGQALIVAADCGSCRWHPWRYAFICGRLAASADRPAIDPRTHRGGCMSALRPSSRLPSSALRPSNRAPPSSRRPSPRPSISASRRAAAVASLGLIRLAVIARFRPSSSRLVHRRPSAVKQHRPRAGCHRSASAASAVGGKRSGLEPSSGIVTLSSASAARPRAGSHRSLAVSSLGLRGRMGLPLLVKQPPGSQPARLCSRRWCSRT